MMMKQEMEFFVEKEIQAIQQKRLKNREMLLRKELTEKELHKLDTELLRKLEGLYIQRNVTKILF